MWLNVFFCITDPQVSDLAKGVKEKVSNIFIFLKPLYFFVIHIFDQYYTQAIVYKATETWPL